MPRDSVGNTIKVALLLCLVCSFVVSAAAVGLRSQQRANKIAYMRRNILEAAGFWKKGANVDELLQHIETRIVDLDTGKFVDEAGSDLKIDPEKYDQKKAIRDNALSEPLSVDRDPASIKRREKYSYVYLINKDGRLDQIVLPIRGYGLWSTLWGFLSLDVESLMRGPEETVVRGITYYQHAETPGLGGEVDNPLWKGKWLGKKIFDENWDVVFEVTKGAQTEYEVDALSGATITSRGVTNMIEFWLGEDGFEPFLKNMQQRLKQQSEEARDG